LVDGALYELVIDLRSPFEKALEISRFKLLRWVDALIIALVFILVCISSALFQGLKTFLFLLSHPGFPLDGSLLKLHGFFFLELHLPLVAQIEQVDRVVDQVLFDLEVKRTVCSKRWGVVHLEDPWFKPIINVDIEPKYLEAH